MLRKLFGKETGSQPVQKVAIDQLGKVSGIDWETAIPGADRREILELRTHMMQGSYGRTPRLIVDMTREVKESGATEFNLETAHDALVTILQKSGQPIDLTNKESIDAAIIAYTDRNR